MKKTIEQEAPYFFKKFKTYDVEDILVADSTTAFGRVTDDYPKNYIIWDPSKKIILK